MNLLVPHTEETNIVGNDWALDNFDQHIYRVSTDEAIATAMAALVAWINTDCSELPKEFAVLDQVLLPSSLEVFVRKTEVDEIFRSDMVEDHGNNVVVQIEESHRARRFWHLVSIEVLRRYQSMNEY